MSTNPTGYLTTKRQDNESLILRGNVNGYDFDSSYHMNPGESIEDTLKRMERELMVKRFQLSKQIDRVRFALMQDA